MTGRKNAQIPEASSALDSNSKHIVEYDILRVIVTVLVVLGHATYTSHITDYGGCDYTVFFEKKSLFLQGMSYLTTMIYLFHMPLFMALSGALFCRSMKRGKYRHFNTLLIEKGKRLLIPYFLVGVLYSFPLKYLSGYYANSNKLFRDFFMGQLLIRDDTHLWFLLTLFCIFIISYLLETYWPGHMCWKLGLMACAFVTNRLCGWRWQSPMEMTLWFYLGLWFESQRTKFYHWGGVRWKHLFVVGAILVLTMAVKYLLHWEWVEKLVIAPILTIECSCATYLFAALLAPTGFLRIKICRLLLRDSFGIYLYADPLNYPILAAGFAYFNSRLFTDMLPSMGLYAARVLGTITVSILICHIVRKCGLRYLC